MTWNGNLLPCGMFQDPKISLLEHSFSEGWDYIVKEAAKLETYAGCETCKKKRGCSVCAAGCLAESGNMTKKPDYLCRMAEEYCRLLLPFVRPENQEEYLKMLEN